MNETLPQWLDSHTVADPDAVIGTWELLEAYNAQAEPALSDRAFGQALSRLRPGVRGSRKRNYQGREMASIYRGIRLRQAGEPEQNVGRRTSEPEQGAVGGAAMLPVAMIDPSPYQARRRFDQGRLLDLAASVSSHGVIQPVVVRPSPGGARDRWELLAGERRLRASRMAGRAEIPAIIRTGVDDRAAAEIGLLENLQREDLSPVEAAHGYRGLEGIGYTHEQIGRALGLERSTITNTLRLLDLPGAAQEEIDRGNLSASHGQELLRFAGGPAALGEIAARAAENHTPARSLRTGLPFAPELQRAGLAQDLNASGTGFDWRQEECVNCPFSARIDAGPTTFCIRPEHIGEVHMRAMQRKIDARGPSIEPTPRFRIVEGSGTVGEHPRPALTVDGPSAPPELPMPTASVVPAESGPPPMPASDYVVIGPERPADCGPKCSCYHVTEQEGRQVEFCTQPGRYEGRLAMQRKEEVRAAVRERLRQALALPLLTPQVALRRAVALVVWEAIHRLSPEVRRGAGLEGQGLPSLQRAISKPLRETDAPDVWPLLEGEQGGKLVVFAAEVLMREEMLHAHDRGEASTPMLDFYLGGQEPAREDLTGESAAAVQPSGPPPALPPIAAGTGEDAEGVEDGDRSRCERCGDPFSTEEGVLLGAVFSGPVKERRPGQFCCPDCARREDEERPDTVATAGPAEGDGAPPTRSSLHAAATAAPCHTCGAAAGQPCTNYRGHPMGHAHSTRREAATGSPVAADRLQPPRSAASEGAGVVEPGANGVDGPPLPDVTAWWEARKTLAAKPANRDLVALFRDDSAGWLVGTTDAVIGHEVLGMPLENGLAANFAIPLVRIPLAELDRAAARLIAAGHRVAAWPPTEEERAANPWQLRFALGDEVTWDEDGRQRRGRITGFEYDKWAIAGDGWSTRVDAGEPTLRRVEKRAATAAKQERSSNVCKR